jgi:hypothetical protein
MLPLKFITITGQLWRLRIKRMACTFYVLPARETLGQQFANFLTDFFPGLDLTKTTRAELADAVTSLAETQDDVFVVHRDELENADLEWTLVNAFGAEQGDLIVEVIDSHDTPRPPARLWRVTTEAEVIDSDEIDEIEEIDEDETLAAATEE